MFNEVYSNLPDFEQFSFEHINILIENSSLKTYFSYIFFLLLVFGLAFLIFSLFEETKLRLSFRLFLPFLIFLSFSVIPILSSLYSSFDNLLTEWEKDYVEEYVTGLDTSKTVDIVDVQLDIHNKKAHFVAAIDGDIYKLNSKYIISNEIDDITLEYSIFNEDYKHLSRGNFFLEGFTPKYHKNDIVNKVLHIPLEDFKNKTIEF